MPKNENQANPPDSSKNELQKNVKCAAEIFDRYWDTIHDLIQFQSNDTSQADDIFHDLFLSLVQKPVPPQIKNIKRYLSRAVRNDIIDAKRREMTYSARILKYVHIPKGAHGQRTPVDMLIRSEQFRMILSLIQEELRPHEAKALIYRFLYNLDIADAAEKMNINKRSFSRYLCIALKKIRRLVKERKLHDINKNFP